MNNQVYKALSEFIGNLKQSERDWRLTKDLVLQQLDTHQGVLKIFGKTKQEQVSALLRYAALLITEPETPEEYPAINFMNGNQD